MRRRAFIAVLGGAAAAPTLLWPLAARAQSSNQIRRIGVLLGITADDPEGQRYVAVFLKGLQDLGWVPGRNLQIEYRWAGADSNRIRAYAAELVGLRPDIIVANSPLVVAPLQQQTQAIPIVFTQITDPVGSGFVASLARPGGNITGFTPGQFSMFGKYPELLKEIAPEVTQMTVILNLDQTPQVGTYRVIEAVGPLIGANVTAASVHEPAEIDRAIESVAHAPHGGLIVLANPITIVNRRQIITLAARYRLPAVYAYRYFVTDGGLMSYGVDVPDLFKRSASYVDRILRGEKPGDLPVQQPTKFEFVVNLRTAKALGLTIPESTLLRADELIE